MPRFFLFLFPSWNSAEGVWWGKRERFGDQKTHMLCTFCKYVSDHLRACVRGGSMMHYGMGDRGDFRGEVGQFEGDTGWGWVFPS